MKKKHEAKVRPPKEQFKLKVKKCLELSNLIGVDIKKASLLKEAFYTM